MERARSLLGLPTRSAFIRAAVMEKLEGLDDRRIIQVRDMTRKEARRRIDDYLQKHPGSHYPSDLAEVLGIDLRLAFNVVQELIDDGRAKLGEE